MYCWDLSREDTLTDLSDVAEHICFKIGVVFVESGAYFALVGGMTRGRWYRR